MMLSAALTKMMDKTECLFFINTPESINPSQVINDNRTKSPWIYYEIAISKYIQKPLSKHREYNNLFKSKTKLFSEQKLFESLKKLNIDYKLPDEHLTKIDNKDLEKWNKKYKSEIPKNDFALNVLYDLHGLDF